MADERKDQPAAENVDKADDAVGTLPAERKGRFDGDAEDEQAPSALPWAEKWLSAERLTPYLKACGGDAEKALALYEWNSSLAQLLMRDISNFEVALRNACNAAMESSWQGDAHWLLDENSPGTQTRDEEVSQGHARLQPHQPKNHRCRRGRPAQGLLNRQPGSGPDTGLLGAPERSQPRGRHLALGPLPSLAQGHQPRRAAGKAVRHPTRAQPA